MDSEAAKLLGSTIQIPVEAIFGELPVTDTAHLAVSIPNQEAFRQPLTDEPIVFGRHSSCSILLLLTNVSRQHAEVSRVGEDYVLKDLGSTNGTFVNNVKVSRCILRQNDLIRIGEATILFAEQKNG